METPDSLPAIFTDLMGREWRLELNYGLARHIKKTEGVDFIAAHNGEAMARCLNDTEKFIDCLWLLCEEQIKARDLDARGFASGFDGSTLAAAYDALAECILNFIQPDLKNVAAASLARLREGRGLALQLALDKVTGPAVTQAVQAQVQRASEEADRKLADLTRGKSGSTTPR